MKLFNKIASKIANSVAQDSVSAIADGESTAEMTALCKTAGAEGIVMLKNDKNVLPIGSKTVSVFGRVARDYFYVGYGSGGDVNVTHRVSIYDGLANANIKINEELAEIYEAWCKKNPVDDGWWGHWPTCYDEMPLSEEVAKQAAKKSDVAIIVIGRAAGEDRENLLQKGSWYLTDEEKNMIEKVTEAFSEVVLLLDCGNIMDISELLPYLNDGRISSALYVWQGGMESGNAIAAVLSGEVSPCGKLPVTIAKKYEYYPSSKNFGNTLCNNYAEDIFVDYKYFETFAPSLVAYPFGFGLSYTKFELKTTAFRKDGKNFNIYVNVKNIGDVAGKEVVQVYVEPPCGILGKEKRRLIAFGKTKELQPGEEEKMKLTFDDYACSSFDDSGDSGYLNAYVLEGGEYKIYVGTDVRNASHAKSFSIGKTVVVSQLTQIAPPVNRFERLVVKPEADGTIKPKTLPVSQPEYDLKKRILDNLPKTLPITGDVGLKLADVKSGLCTMEEFVAQLSFDELESISRGDYKMDSPLGAKGNAGAFAGVEESLREKGIPAVITTDGPSGIRIGAKCSLIPNGNCLAATFDTELVQSLYSQIGLEMKDRGSDVLLAPGMNIQRNPLCGRNFEYYSTDALLTGKIAAACIRGIQSAGVSACPKHFACNNQETNRTHNDSEVSVRALREIYLKGFEIAVKEGKPKNIMTSYNKINGVWGHYNYDLCTVVLRGEWGYEGSVMTDWWMRSSDSPEFPGVCDQGYRIRAGVNVLMPGAQRLVKGRKADGTAKKSLKAKDGLTIGEMQKNAMLILSYIAEEL